MKKLLFILALAGGTFLIIYTWGLLNHSEELVESPKPTKQNPARGQPQLEKPREGFLVPDFTLASLKGETIKLADFRGKPVLLNFWATWCPPCRAEMPLLEKLYQQKGNEIQVLTVNIQEDKQTIKDFMKKNDYSFPVLLDQQGKVANQYWIQGIPATFIIDQQGVVQAVWVGALEPETLKGILKNVNLN